MKKKKVVKKRNLIVLQMISIKGFGYHKKTNKQLRRKEKIKLNNEE